MSLLLDEDTTKRLTRDAALATLSDELKAEMQVLLESPGLLAWIMESLRAVQIVGEWSLALTLYLVGTSRLLRKPLAVIVQGPSSSGKSHVIEQVASLFPPAEVLLATDLTPNALYYLPAGELAHRLVVAGERSRKHNEDSANATKALREMISSGRLQKIVTDSDGEGPRSECIEQKGPIAYVESTTATELFNEDANRCLILQSDESAAQTQRILQARGLQLQGTESFQSLADLRTRCHALQWLLEPVEVVIPYGARLSVRFPNEPLEVRRAFEQVVSFIQACALLLQRQRQRDASGRVIAQPEDYWLTRQLIGPVIARSLGQRPAPALVRFVAELLKHQISGTYTAQEIGLRLTTNDKTVRNHLNALLQRGKVEQAEPPKGQTPAQWLIPAGISLDEDTDEWLPSVEEVCECSLEDLALPELSAEWTAANLTGVPF